MAVYFQEDDQHIVVRGKTYPYRELMRSLGGQYQAGDKTWILPLNQDNLARVQELCRSVGGGLKKLDAPPAPSETSETVAPPVAATDPLVDPLADGLSINELMQQAQLVIAQGFPRSVWVLGEIQNFRSHASGMYFQLADFKEGASRSATQTVNATLWRSQYQDLQRKWGLSVLQELLQDGIRVRVLVDVTLYKDRGQLSLQVQGIDPNFTKGSLALARERLLRELRSKGLDRQNKALSVPAFPFKIGLISAPDSRARSDFEDQLQLYKFPGSVTFFAAQMQGEKTLEDVVRGIQFLSEQECDLIVITRGGGSAADLRWFDSPEIAYAIALCPLPIVAAIGHHEDVCVAEEICYQREKTPTAAADFVVSLFQRTRERVEQLSLVLSQRLQDRIRLQDKILANLRERLLLTVRQVLLSFQMHGRDLESQIDMHTQRRLVLATAGLQQFSRELQQRSELRFQSATNRLRHLAETLHHQSSQALMQAMQDPAQLGQELKAQSERQIFARRESLFHLEKSISQRDPRPWLDQGWTQLSSPEGRLGSIQDAKVGMELFARLKDGQLRLLVKDIKASEKDQNQ